MPYREELTLKPSLWLFVLISVAISTAHAQPKWPEKPVRLVVASAAGGGDDFLMRLISPKLTEVLGQQFIVESRPGAGGLIGQTYVQKSAPDGYTWLYAGGSMAGARLINSNVTYDVLRDFTPVSQIGTSPYFLIVHPGVPAKNLKEYLALARQPNAKVNFATVGGQMPYWTAMHFSSLAHIKATEVPYRNATDAVIDVISGRVDYYFAPAALYVANKSRLRALGVSTAKRSPAFPDIPSIAEAGVPGYDLFGWGGIAGPAGVRRDIVDTLNGAIRKTLAMADVRDKMLSIGIEPTPGSPEGQSKRYAQQMQIFTKIAKDAGLKPQ